MNRLLYIHGLSSSGTSKTTQGLRKLLPDFEILAPDLPLFPLEVMNLLQTICREFEPTIVVGTSMGGMFAQKLFGYNKILVNPAFHVSEHMRRMLGKHPFMNPRKDGQEFFEITNELCESYFELEQRQFENITDNEKEITYALFGERDELVNCREEYLMFYIYESSFSGEHRLSYKNIAVR